MLKNLGHALIAGLTLLLIILAFTAAFSYAGMGASELIGTFAKSQNDVPDTISTTDNLPDVVDSVGE